MKIQCPCGATVHDGGDRLPHKAHLVPDAVWFDLLDAIDDAIDGAGSTKAARESAQMAVRYRLAEVTRRAWQCRSCGRLFVDDARRDLQTFVPADPQTSRSLFAGGVKR